MPDRTGTVYADWLSARGPALTSRLRTATLDPFHGYANAIRDEHLGAITVLGACHVVRLGGQEFDEVRRRVQQDTLGHHGRAGTRCTRSAASCRSEPSTSLPSRSPA
ncbi:transposase [Kocuria aegyptia]|uniref:transposase n=1 Tax=Kocuria aegyptia TaxID=330943 RepID=UPI0031D1A8EF